MYSIVVDGRRAEQRTEPRASWRRARRGGLVPVFLDSVRLRETHARASARSVPGARRGDVRFQRGRFPARHALFAVAGRKVPEQRRSGFADGRRRLSVPDAREQYHYFFVKAVIEAAPVVLAWFGRCSRASPRCLPFVMVASAEALSAEIRPRPRGLRPPWYPRRGKEVKIQGVSVRATRKPKGVPRSPVARLSRFAERRSPGMSYQAPPRNTRSLHSPLRHALPSAGAPA